MSDFLTEDDLARVFELPKLPPKDMPIPLHPKLIEEARKVWGDAVDKWFIPAEYIPG